MSVRLKLISSCFYGVATKRFHICVSFHSGLGWVWFRWQHGLGHDRIQFQFQRGWGRHWNHLPLYCRLLPQKVGVAYRVSSRMKVWARKPMMMSCVWCCTNACSTNMMISLFYVMFGVILPCPPLLHETLTCSSFVCNCVSCYHVTYYTLIGSSCHMTAETRMCRRARRVRDERRESGNPSLPTMTMRIGKQSPDPASRWPYRYVCVCVWNPFTMEEQKGGLCWGYTGFVVSCSWPGCLALNWCILQLTFLQQWQGSIVVFVLIAFAVWWLKDTVCTFQNQLSTILALCCTI